MLYVCMYVYVSMYVYKYVVHKYVCFICKVLNVGCTIDMA